MLEYLLATTLIAVYVAIFFGVRKYGWGSRIGLGTMGPAIIWKTGRGRRLIDRIAARKSVWMRIGDLSMLAVAVTMVAMLLLLMWEATIVVLIPAERAPRPEMLLGIPGINPVIPVVYGVLGLIVAIVVHEFSHGVMARAHELKVRSLGILFLVIPLGAFVEPDEEELASTRRRSRMRVYAAGPTSNLLIAFVTFMLFILMVNSLQPVEPGSVAVAVSGGTPASRAGIPPYTLLTSINGTTVRSTADLDALPGIDPLTHVNVTGRYRNEEVAFEGVPAGLVVISTLEGFPAEKGGLAPGMVLSSISHSNTTVPIRNQNDFRSALAGRLPGDRIDITVYEYDPTSAAYVRETIPGIELTSRYEYFLKYSPSQNSEEYRRQAFLGVTTGYMGMLTADPETILAPVKSPFSGADSPPDIFLMGLRFLSLPLLGLSPMESPFSDIFAPGGAFSSLPLPVFWFLLNTLYWVFWLNVMVGLTNALPIVALDGGQFFRDEVDWAFTRLALKDREKRVQITTGAVAVFVVFLIFWQLIGPRIA